MAPNGMDHFHLNPYILIQQMILLYKSVGTIYIRKVIKIENDDNGFKYDKSILITDSLLLNIYYSINGYKCRSYTIGFVNEHGYCPSGVLLGAL